MVALERKIDSLGRVVLPNDFRELLGIKPNDMLIITSDGSSVTIRRRINVCPICKGDVGKGERVCTSCAEMLRATLS